MGFVWGSIGGKLYKGTEAVQKDAGGSTVGIEDSRQGPGGIMRRSAPKHVPDQTPHSFSLHPLIHESLGSHFEKLSGWESEGYVIWYRFHKKIIISFLIPSGIAFIICCCFSRPSLTSCRSIHREPVPEVARFLINLAVCNTVVPSKDQDGTIQYQARGSALRGEPFGCIPSPFPYLPAPGLLP